MACTPILALFHKLLDLCCRCAARSLSWLFRLFSILSRRFGIPWDRFQGKPPNARSELCGTSDVPTSEARGCIGTQCLSSGLPTERAVVLACASAPSTPPRARTRDYTRSMDSYGSISRSPTLFSPRSSIYSYDGPSCSSPNRLEIIKEGPSFIENGVLQDEPERLYSPQSPTEEIRKQGIVKTIKPMPPSERPRYDRNVAIKSERKWKFKPLGTYDVYESQDIGPWRYYAHPEGNPYYLLKQYTPPSSISYLTEANLKDPDVSAEIESFMNELEARVAFFRWPRRRPENIEVVMEIQNGWNYYMVDLDEQVVFWLDDLDMEYSLGSEFGVESPQQFVSQLNFEYWQHIEHFPNHQHIEPEIFSEAFGAFNYWKVDMLSSADSTAPYEAAELNQFIDSIRSLQSTMRPGHNHAYGVSCIARVMGIIANERYYNFFGSYGARLQVWQSVRGNQKRQHSWLVKYLSPILFYAPDTHLAGLEKLWVDCTIRERRWKKFQDWEGFVLYSTVLLNANVGLLGIPIVFSDNGSDATHWNLFRSPAAIASQLSIIASLASIIIGLLLVRQVRISAKDIEITATDAMTYLCNRKHEQLGLETMAIQYSLPYALLMWGMVTFLAAIVIACFYRVDGWPNAVYQLLYAFTWLFVIPLILWTVITGWETKNHTQLSQLLSSKWWKKCIRLQWKRSDKMKPWTWRVERKGKQDIETPNVGAGNEAAPASPADGSPTSTLTREKKRWHVRVRNFGPIRRLTMR